MVDHVKLGRKSKRKGAAGEREAAAALSSVFPGASFHRGRQYHGGPGTPDVCSTIPGLHLEIKRTESLSIYKAMDQANADAKDAVPVVLHRRNRRKWLAVVELDRLPELVRIVEGYLREEVADCDGGPDTAAGLEGVCEDSDGSGELSGS